jgi:hypothetical protein
MEWSDIAGIVFVCVTMNHLGLISAVEGVIKRKLRIVNCPKCATFWSVLVYMAIVTQDAITTLAVSFLASYAALWVELLEGFIDTIYLKLYGKITTTDNDNTTAADTEEGSPASPVS